MGIRETSISVRRVGSISQRKGGSGSRSGLFSVTPLSGFTFLEAWNGGSERIFTASIDQFRLEGLDLNFNLFGDILVLHWGREGDCRGGMVSMSIGVCCIRVPKSR